MISFGCRPETGLRDGEMGRCDRDGRTTPRGRQYFRMRSLEMRNADPKETVDPLPQLSVHAQLIVLKLIDLTNDDVLFHGD